MPENTAPCIEAADGFFALHTAHTSYLIGCTAAGARHPEHLYYGPRVAVGPDAAATAAALGVQQSAAPGCTVTYDKTHPALCLEQLCQEVSTLGKGDYGTPFAALTFADGSTTADFVLDRSEVLPQGAPLPPECAALPAAHGAAGTLALHLREAQTGAAALTLLYAVYPGCDVITRRAVLQNTGAAPLTLGGLASLQLDLPESDWVFTRFHGGWANEWHRADAPCTATLLAESRLGCTSSRCQNFTMLHRAATTETAGEVIATELLYSGSFRTVAEPGRWGRLRLLCGLNPEGFAWELAPGAAFAAPECVLCYSDAGFGALSDRLHDFTRAHILPARWATDEALARPIVMNSWEACYFRFDEAALLRQARLGAACGVERFVLDDGWFGARDDDTSSLGDWVCNTKKLPDGLAGLSGKLADLGMDFGLWLEPEMVSENSDLYRAHPDWALRHPARPHSEGRGQLMLDLANPAVQDHIIETVSALLQSAAIHYIKWDMNRSVSDVYSPWAAAAGLSQGGTAHRCMLGLYRVLQVITARFPDVLFEACASGGNRTDLGMLCYMPQLWLSDNTDPICRAEMQYNASFALPPCVMSCHASASPNHQTRRQTPLAARFGVAAFGCFGYELDFTALTDEERAQLAEQTAAYKALRRWLPQGRFARLQHTGAVLCWQAAAKDGGTALVLLLEPSAQPDRAGSVLRFHALQGAARYRVQCPGKAEGPVLPGSLLNHAGLRLPAPEPTPGVWSDFSCRLYTATQLPDLP